MRYSSLINSVSNLGYSPCVEASYYDMIMLWNQWYKGYCEKFHKLVDTNGIVQVSRKMNTLNMAKRVSEDWASALLNESAKIVINSGSASVSSTAFIQGTKGDGGVLGYNSFFQNMNSLIERTFALGTGAVVLTLDNIISDDVGNISSDSDSKIGIDFIGALRIIPLSSRNGEIKECMFVSEERVGKDSFYSLQAHVLEDGVYVVRNYCLDKAYKLVKLRLGILPVIRTLSVKPLFQIIKPAITNNTSDNDTPAMGISIFANAISNLMSCDVSFDDYQVELNNGKMRLFMDAKLLPRDSNNQPIYPAASNTTLYQVVGDGESIMSDTYIKEFAPDLRIDSLHVSLQDSLNLLSSAVGLGNHYYNFENTGSVTATEYVGQRNDFVRNCRKHSRALESVISNLILEILWLGKNVLKRNVNTDSEVSVKCSDGVVEDDNAEKDSDRKDVEMGIMLRSEYREKWYGETSDVSKAKIKEIDSESKTTDTSIGF